jgi:hypothetical protein
MPKATAFLLCVSILLTAAIGGLIYIAQFGPELSLRGPLP